ncbi:WYL domain-containing protein [Galbitalea sp. SE-J8]|uniref:helix-turn-helix transcriptional regulator n=1 Tax=Galbitalea sp. SE-J8 TaxID=3054952 RepID=UPI00259CDCAA|nr:WYL domain-containing protein [Galbitalea sp. SE-J8]MDM4764014.1 WYL domain-containing protein [Galbitalea sp. SE-J8]
MPTPRGPRPRSVQKRAPLLAADKLTFLLALVPFVVDRGRVTVAEVAEHFDVEPAQIRDAVELIAVSGVPGETSTYQYEDLFDIDWDAFENDDEIVITNLVAIDDSPRFSAREAAALIAGLQYLAALPENTDAAALVSLTRKLAAGASGEPSQLGVETAAGDATLALIRRAVARGVQLELDYVTSAGASERRRVDPLRVESVDESWYLRGWCHLREAVRTFRLDRMSDVVVTDEPIGHDAADVPLPDVLFEASDDDLVVTIDVAASAMPLIADYVAAGASLEERDGVVRTTVRMSHYHGLKRLVASMPGAVAVVAPEDARRAVAEWAAAGAARYR